MRSMWKIFAGIILGVAIVLSYDFSMEATSTDDFCLSCHNHSIPNQELQTTAHAANASGVVAGCADCHLPHDPLPKFERKIAAAKEVWGHLTGVIDTDDKYLAHRQEMKQREIDRLLASDSAECRNCHIADKMVLEQQSRTAQKKHQQMLNGEKTCIQCHQGVAHTPAVDDDNFEDIDF